MLTDQPIFKFASVICQGNTKEARQCGSGGQRRRHCCCTVGLQYHYTERRQEQSSHYAPPRPSSQSGQRWTPKDLMMVTVEPDFHRFSVLTALYLLGWIISCWAEVDTAWWNRGTDGESSSQPRAWRWVVTCTYMKQEFWVVLTLLDFFCCRTVKATIDLKQQFPNRITLNMTPKYRLGFLFCSCNTKESEQW